MGNNEKREDTTLKKEEEAARIIGMMEKFDTVRKEIQAKGGERKNVNEEGNTEKDLYRGNNIDAGHTPHTSSRRQIPSSVVAGNRTQDIADIPIISLPCDSPLPLPDLPFNALPFLALPSQPLPPINMQTTRTLWFRLGGLSLNLCERTSNSNHDVAFLS